MKNSNLQPNKPKRKGDYAGRRPRSVHASLHTPEGKAPKIMKRLLVSVPADLKRNFKASCARKDQAIRDAVIELLSLYVHKKYRLSQEQIENEDRGGGRRTCPHCYKNYDGSIARVPPKI